MMLVHGRVMSGCCKIIFALETGFHHILFTRAIDHRKQRDTIE